MSRKATTTKMPTITITTTTVTMSMIARIMMTMEINAKMDVKMLKTMSVSGVHSGQDFI